MEWLQISGQVSRDADYLMLLAKRGWLRWQELEERRLLALYGQGYLQEIHLRMKDMGYRPLAPLQDRRYAFRKGD